MFALLGELTFQTLTSFESYRAMDEYHYAEHKVIEARPRVQWIAQELGKISLEMVFHVSFMGQTDLRDPATAMNVLKTAAEDHQARALVFGNGVHRGYFVIESIEETFVQTADDGSIVANSARVELREWVPGADFDPTVPPRSATLPPGILYSNTQALAATGTATGDDLASLFSRE